MKTLRFLLVGLLSLGFVLTVFSQQRPGSLRGTVTDAINGETIPYAKIVLFDKEGIIVGGGNADLDGRYNITPLEPGTYDVQAEFVGYANNRVIDVVIKPNAPTILDFKMTEASAVLEEVVITYKAPLIDKTRSSMVISKESIKSMAVRDVTSVSAQSAGVIHDIHGVTSVRGARTSGTVYFIDGVKVRGSVNIPQAAITQTEVITGGTPAMFGDQPNPLFQYEVNFVSPQSIEYPERKMAETEVEPPTDHVVQARILTAGEIHDFSKWELWQDFSKNEFEEWKNHWSINPTERYSLQVKFDNGVPVIDAEVSLVDKKGKIVYEARTDNTGKAELWKNMLENNGEVTRIEVKHKGQKSILEDPMRFHDGLNFIEIERDCEVPKLIDICFVVDATGSMMDEINYLKAELADVMNRVSSTLPNSNIRLGNVFYRDHHDSYVTRHSEFSEDFSQGISFIKDQYANGGGDFPEAVIEALDVGINKLEWSEEAVTRMMFLILDAPPHHDSNKVKQLQKLISGAAKKGIRIVPIASSGIDKSTEYILRSMALATNGTYTFLTDDSGVGNPHLKPTTDSYEVELLNDLMVRLIHQFAFTPECSQEDKEEDAEELIVSSDTSFVNIIDTLMTIQNDSVSIAELPRKEINRLLKEEFTKDLNWHYYPNPTRDFVNVEFNHKINEVFLTDLRGKILVRKDVENKDHVQLNLEPYPIGTYFIKFLHDGRWITERVIRAY